MILTIGAVVVILGTRGDGPLSEVDEEMVVPPVGAETKVLDKTKEAGEMEAGLEEFRPEEDPKEVRRLDNYTVANQLEDISYKH